MILKMSILIFGSREFNFYDENLEDIIIDTIRRAKNEICIAMAYFTSDILIDELYRSKDKGFNIKVIIDING